MKMIEIYNEHGKVGTIINGGHISIAYGTERDGKVCVRIEFNQSAEDFRYIYSYETLENFQKRTGDRWVELECGENPINVKPSTIVGYRREQKGICFWISGNVDGFICTETIESFERKIGIRKEDAE